MKPSCPIVPTTTMTLEKHIFTIAVEIGVVFHLVILHLPGGLLSCREFLSMNYRIYHRLFVYSVHAFVERSQDKL